MYYLLLLYTHVTTINELLAYLPIKLPHFVISIVIANILKSKKLMTSSNLKH
jgi:ABC-type sulfate transport system permease component